MARFIVNTSEMILFRKDIIASTHFSIQAKLLLSSLLVLNRHECAEITNEYLQKLYGLTAEEVDKGIGELEDKGLVSKQLSKDNGTKYFKYTLHPIINTYFPRALKE